MDLFSISLNIKLFSQMTIMFFGRTEPKSININAFDELITDLFNKKIAKLDNKAMQFMIKIEDSKKAFIETCNDFEKLEDEPDIEAIGFSKSEQVKYNKHLYVLALKRIFEKTNIMHKPKTAYHKCQEFAAENELMLSSILKVNNTFKTVLYAYSRNLDNFRNLFSIYENAVKKLKNEIDKYSQDMNEYSTIMNMYEKLADQLLDKAGLEQELAGIAVQNPSKISSKNNNELEALAQEYASRISSTNAKISSLKLNIISLFSHLDKPAKKFDYSSNAKIKIREHMNERGLEMLGNPKIYNDFLKQIIALKKYIKENEANIKNSADAENNIDIVLSGKLKDYIDKLNILNNEKNTTNTELANLKNELKAIENTNTLQEQMHQDYEIINKDILEIKEKISTNKKLLESLVNNAYKDKITIIF